MSGISKVGKEVVNGASASVDGLEPSTHHSQHSQSPILDLLCSQLLDLVGRTASPAKRVEPEPTWVANISPGELVVGENGVSVDAPRLDDVSPSSPLSPTDENHLNNEECGFVGEVLQFSSSVPGWGV